MSPIECITVVILDLLIDILFWIHCYISDDVRQKFNNMKNYYVKEKKRQIQPSGSSGGSSSKWEWFKSLSFLDFVTTPGPSESNLCPEELQLYPEESQLCNEVSCFLSITFSKPNSTLVIIICIRNEKLCMISVWRMFL